MQDHLDKYIRDKPPEVDGDHTDLQRAALRELIKLSTHAVQPAESQIDKQYRAASQKAEKIFQDATQKTEQRFQTLEDTARHTYQNRINQVRNRFESESNALEADTKATRERIVDQAESAANDARKAYEHDVWLAESIADATGKKLRKEFKQIQKEVPAAINRLESLHQRARHLLQEYRQEPPADSPPPDQDPTPAQDPVETFRQQADTFRQQYESAQQLLTALKVLTVPRLFMGLRPYALAMLLCTASVALAGSLTFLNAPHWPSFLLTGPIVFLATLALALVAGKVLRRLARAQVNAAYLPLQQALANARLALDQRLELAAKQLEHQKANALAKRDAEIQKAKNQLDARLADIHQRRATSLQQVEEAYTRQCAEIHARRDANLQRVNEAQQHKHPDQQQYEKELAIARERFDRQTKDCQNRYDSARAALEGRWKQGLACIQALLDQTTRLNNRLSADWDDPAWQQWTPPREFAPVVRFGQLHVDMNQLAESVRQHAPFDVDQSPTVSLPALLAFPDRCSLLLQTDREGREKAIKTLRAVMVRLLTSLPPGRVHFTIIDPVGLGENFAGFMHLADYEEALVGGRIWTESAHIEQRLTDLTNHMENVIQKYLRNEFKTIDAYNLQAGELAEPYRFLVVANFPANFNEQAARRLSSILSSGPRCGVYTLIAHDTRHELPPGIRVEDIEANSAHLVYHDDRFVWQDEIFRQFPLTLDAPPSEQTLTRLMHQVGTAAKDSTRVEVPFDIIAPENDQCWTRNSSQDLHVPVGRTGAVRLQQLTLGRDVAQHVLIAGKTGSGKSTLLHVIITNLALWYRPDEVEFYLVDFKKGVEFKTYVTHELAHARAIAIESDREFGLSVLQRLDEEMERRGNLFRQHGVQDLPAYRHATGAILPRTLLIVDEFQVFFSEDDRLAQDAAILLDRLVRQGRAFGIHVLLGSQTLGGTSGLARSTIGQMAVRIALQCAEADAQLILDDDNVAARLLSRPGEAIYNDGGGIVQRNSPFQTAWLPDERRDEYLDRVADLARQRPDRPEPLIVFEGNAPADISKNRLLARLLEAPDWPQPSAPPRVWLGEAVAIKDPTSAPFRRQSGANLLIVGQRDDAAMALMTAALVSLAAQHAPQSASFFILDGTPTDSPLAGNLQRIASLLPHPTRVVEFRDVPTAIAQLAAETQRRQQADQTDAPAVYLLIYGLQRFRVLRRTEDDFSFSRDDPDKPPSPDKQFAEVLREGPPLGLHTLAWSDTPATVDRTLDRQTTSEFDNRVLFQMSAADSSNLIDSPLANMLGFYRALFCSEEQGVLEKFRPYAPPTKPGSNT